MAAPSNTVIIGAGIIGVSTAYYLSLSPTTPAQTIHLVEASSELFASASGYAAGFLAKDWFGTATASLGALSFELHKQLALQHNGKHRWGYSSSTGTSVTKSLKKVAVSRRKNQDHDWSRDGGSRASVVDGTLEFGAGQGAPPWLRQRQGFEVEVISDGTSTAQCDPLRLCQFLLEECKARGVELHQPARALSVSKDMRGELAAIRIGHDSGKETDLPCSRLVITAGAWSPLIWKTLFPDSKHPHLPISSLSGHSLVIRSPRWSAEHEDKGCHAVFAADEGGFSPEIFSRIGGEIYLAGLNDANIPLPKVATDSRPGKKQIESLEAVAKRMLGLDMNDDLQVLRGGLCFRPVTDNGTPIVSRVEDSFLGSLSTRGGGEGGVFLSAGHGPWGISQSLGTGLVMTEMIEGKPTSADVSRLALT